MTNHYWDRVTAPRADRDRSEPPTPAERARAYAKEIDAVVRAENKRLLEWQRDVCDLFGYDSEEPGAADEVLTYLPAWLGGAAGDSEYADRAQATIARRDAIIRGTHEIWNGTQNVNWLRMQIRERWPVLATALDALRGPDRTHCEGHGGPGRWYCCQHPDAGWPCTETVEDES